MKSKKQENTCAVSLERLPRIKKRKAASPVTGAASAQQRVMLDRARHEMHVSGSLRCRRGGSCAKGGATTASIWDHWEIVPRQRRQRYHRVRWTFFWFPHPDVMQCRQKEFRFRFKDRTTALTPAIQERILNDYRSMPIDLATFGGGDKIKGQWELP